MTDNIEPCYMCNNARVDDELTDYNDLSYIGVGKGIPQTNMYVRAGNRKPVAIIVSQFNKETCRVEDIAIYEPNYCPNCGRRLYEYDR